MCFLPGNHGLEKVIKCDLGSCKFGYAEKEYFIVILYNNISLSI